MKHLFKHSKKDKVEKDQKEDKEKDKEKRKEKKKDKISSKHKVEEDKKEQNIEEGEGETKFNDHGPVSIDISDITSSPSKTNEVKIGNNQETKPLQSNSLQSTHSLAIPSLNITRTHPPSPLGTPPQQLPSGLSSLSQPSQSPQQQQQQPLSPRSSSSSSSSSSSTTTTIITLTALAQQQQQQQQQRLHPPPSPLHTHIEVGGKKATSLSPKDKLETVPSYLAFMEDTNEKTLSRKDKRKSLFSPLFPRNLFAEQSSPRKPAPLSTESSVPTSPRGSGHQKEDRKEKRRSVLFRRESSMNMALEKEQQTLSSPTMELSKEEKKEKRRSVLFRRESSMNMALEKEQQTLSSPTMELSKEEKKEKRRSILFRRESSMNVALEKEQTLSSPTMEPSKEEKKEKRRSILFRKGSGLNIGIDKEQQTLSSPPMEPSKEDTSNDKKASKKHAKKKSADLVIKESSPVEIPLSERASQADKLPQSPQKTPHTFGRKNRKKIMSMQIKDSSIIFAANMAYEAEIKTARDHPRHEAHSAAHSRDGSAAPRRLSPIHVTQSIFVEAKKDIFSLMSSYSFQNWKLKNPQFFHIHGKNEVLEGKNDDDDVKDDVITLEKVLENSELSKSFELFLKSEFSAENIYFYREAERFERQMFENQLEMDREALRIYEKFLAPGTDLQVNVSSAILGKVHLELFGEPISKDENDQSWMRWFVPTEYSPKAVEVANAAAAAASAKNGYGSNGLNGLNGMNGMNGGFENQGSQLPPQIACLMSSSSQPSMVDLSDKTKKRRSIFFKKT